VAIAGAIKDVADFVFHAATPYPLPHQPPAPVATLHAAFDALMDVAGGKRNELLTPATTGGRPAVPMEEQAARTDAALAATCLQQSGLSTEQACRQVARRIGWEFGPLSSFRKKVASGNLEQVDPDRPDYSYRYSVMLDIAREVISAFKVDGDNREAWRMVAESIQKRVRVSIWSRKRVPEEF